MADTKTNEPKEVYCEVCGIGSHRDDWQPGAEPLKDKDGKVVTNKTATGYRCDGDTHKKDEKAIYNSQSGRLLEDKSKSAVGEAEQQKTVSLPTAGAVH